MKIIVGLVVVVVLVAIISGIQAISKRLFRKNAPHTTPPTSSTKEGVAFASLSPPAVPTQMSDSERRHRQLKDTLRVLPHNDEAGTSALVQHLTVSDPFFSTDDVLNTAVEVGFSMESLVNAMGMSNFSLDEILSFVDENYTFDLPELTTLLFALPHESSPLDWSTSVVGAVCEKYDVDDLDDEDINGLVIGALACGCTKEEIAKVLYAEFDFKTVLSALAQEEEVTSEYIAQVARGADADLTEGELYDSLREDYSLALVAGALKILGTERDTILDCEAVHLGNEYNEVDGALEDMEDSGFSATEILTWLIDSEYSTLSAEDVITEAFESAEEETLSEDELVWLSLTLEDEIDISDIERQLIEDEVDFEKRIEFLYKLFVAQRDARAAKEAQSTIEEVVTT